MKCSTSRDLPSRRESVRSFSNTATSNGLTVKCAVDTRVYKTGIEVSDTELASVRLKPDKFHGEWNYTVRK
ncbi:MAG: ISAzo13-like element transposase-related protein [Thermoguttaceae bacterium]